MRPIRVAHVMPGLKIGGVEVGVNKSFESLNKTIDYRVFYIRHKGEFDCNQRHVLALIFGLLTGRWRPDVIVTSLWMAHPIGYLIKFLGVKWVAFFHSASYASKRDRLWLKFAWLHADVRFCDSKATASAMSTFAPLHSFLVPYIFSFKAKLVPTEDRANDFCWIGRVANVKRLDIMLRIIDITNRLKRSDRFVLILAGDISSSLQHEISRLGGSVTVHKNLLTQEVFDILSDTKYYVLTSDYEGMSMSTIESIQAGCLPIVRPVGEIPSYLDQDSGLFLNGIADEDIIKMITHLDCLKQQPDAIYKMLINAQHRVSSLPRYVESFVHGIEMTVCK
jgi:glycosyltransferase involved in cell wall biosynthesis